MIETLANFQEESDFDNDDSINIDRNSSSSDTFSSWGNHVPVEVLKSCYEYQIGRAHV